MPLRVAAKVDAEDRAYFADCIQPIFDGRHVEYLGEIDDTAKNDLLGGALAYLFPINWPEPFGITMIEAMACGTPVIAMLYGSVPEVVEHGRTGFICRSIDEMIEAVGRVDRLSRQACRRRVEERFSVSRMADDYEAVYRAVADEQQRGAARKVGEVWAGTVPVARSGRDPLAAARTAAGSVEIPAARVAAVNGGEGDWRPPVGDAKLA